MIRVSALVSQPVANKEQYVYKSCLRNTFANTARGAQLDETQSRMFPTKG